MAFQLTRLNVPSLTTDFSAETNAAAGLAKTIGGLPAEWRKLQEAETKRQAIAEVGERVKAGDLAGAGQRLLMLGDVGNAASFLKLGQDAQNRKLSQDATQGLASALGGGFLGSVQPQGAAPVVPGTASLIQNESGGKWRAQNDATGAGGAKGHFGRAQFGQARLQEAAAAGAIPPGTTPQAFMASPELQQRAEQWHFSDIDQAIKQNGYDQLVGKAAIGGVPVTVEGLRAVAHLGGKEGMRKFVETQGAYNPADANGTRLSDYFARHGGARRAQTASADIPAPGATPAAMESEGAGFAVPGSPSMTGRTFDAITGDQALDPVFQSEGVSQPWMGSTLQRQPVATVAQRPPRRPAMLGQLAPADVPAAGAVPAIGQMPQAMIEDLSNTPDAGSRTFMASQGSNAPAPAPMAPRGTSGAVPFSANSSAPATDATNQRADLPAVGAPPTQGTGPSQPPITTAEMPPPRTKEAAFEYGMTKQMEMARGKAGRIASALANPNLPANARALGEIFLKEALEESKAPESVKEFTYAKAMGWTTAKSPAEYAKEKTGGDATPAIKEYEYAKRNGFAGSILDYEREKAASKAKPGISASDQKSIFAAEDQIPLFDNTIETLRRARELNSQTYTGTGAGIRGMIGTSGIPGTGLVTDPAKSAATREFGQIMSLESIKSMSDLLKGATTDREMANFQALMADPSTPPEIRARQLDRMMRLVERQKGIAAARIDELRSKAGIGSPRQSAPQGTPKATPQGAPQRQPQAVAAPPAAVEFLRANPGARDQFDAKYGPGASAAVLGQ